MHRHGVIEPTVTFSLSLSDRGSASASDCQGQSDSADLGSTRTMTLRRLRLGGPSPALGHSVPKAGPENPVLGASV